MSSIGSRFFVSALPPRVKQLDVAEVNLGQMVGALNGTETDAVNKVESEKNEFFWQLTRPNQ
jgi:hypothetical protein